MFSGLIVLFACIVHFSTALVTCPALTVANANPPSGTCSNDILTYNTRCTFTCNFGYQLKGCKERVCQQDLSWSGKPTSCEDIQPPSLTCPFIISAITTKGKATGIVSWKVEVTDNSVVADANAKITVKSSHQPLQEFPIGTTSVRVNATDSAGNVATCSFNIVIRDVEPPTVSFCPADIVQEEKELQVRVNWKRPTFSDNSGQPVAYYANRQSGDLFVVPSVTQIQYIASDGAQNVNNNCSFKITLKKKSCPIFSPPRNGALACITTSGLLQCAVMCKDGTDFESNPPLLYYCQSGEWHYWALPGQPYTNIPWPSCSAQASPSWMQISNFPQFYYSGDVHDPNVQAAIKNQFYSILTSPYVPPPFCVLNSAECTVDTISVSPGVVG